MDIKPESFGRSLPLRTTVASTCSDAASGPQLSVVVTARVRQMAIDNGLDPDKAVETARRIIRELARGRMYGVVTFPRPRG